MQNQEIKTVREKMRALEDRDGSSKVRIMGKNRKKPEPFHRRNI